MVNTNKNTTKPKIKKPRAQSINIIPTLRDMGMRTKERIYNSLQYMTISELVTFYNDIIGFADPKVKSPLVLRTAIKEFKFKFEHIITAAKVYNAKNPETENEEICDVIREALAAYFILPKPYKTLPYPRAERQGEFWGDEIDVDD